MKATSRHLLCAGLAVAAVWSAFRVVAADSLETLDTRDARIRERYEQVLERNPFQERAFDQVFESYLNWEGIDAWSAKLKLHLEDAGTSAAILLGQIYARQFKTAEAIEMLEKARQTAGTSAAPAEAAQSPAFNRLLGTLYYRQGENKKGIRLLSQALAALSDLEERTQVSRMLGNLFLRQGDTEQAVEVWKQIAAQSPDDLFAQIELGAIYEENRLWDEAVEVYRRIATRSEQEPYRRCQALRSIGNCQLQAERFSEAIAAYETALELVSPGNWLFEDLKLRLVQAHEDMGNLEGLIDYVSARLKQNPADLEFRDLLAETHLRMNRLETAESEYQAILERNPRHAPTFEKLIVLYQRLKQPDKLAAVFEKLIELFPNDADYLRRFGEAHWQAGNIEQAQQTWERLIAEPPTPGQWAELASWYELYEFPENAIRCYRQALADLNRTTNANCPANTRTAENSKEWAFRLAQLLFDKGENDQALAIWQSTLNTDASGAEYAEVASILDARQQIEKAEPLWKTAVEKSPENLDFSLQLARNLMRQEKFEEAAVAFARLADQTENPYFQDRGETGRLDAWHRLGILAEKQAAWEKELLEQPDSIAVISRLAKLYQRAGQRESALALLEKRTQLQPDNTSFRRALIRAYKTNRLIDEAIKELLRLAGEDKTRARVYHRELLEIYLSLDLRDEALATAEKIVELAPADAESRIDLAQVYTLYQRPEEGLQQYRYALRLKPDEPDYRRQYGEALKQQKKWGEAQIVFQKMLDAATDNGIRLSAVAQLAQIHQQQNTADELIADFTRRIRNTPKKLTAYQELARIHQETGHPMKTLAVLEEGLQNADDKAPALQSLIRAAYEAQDFPKVIGYYEQWLARKGKPSAYEYEKLGSIYAQLGDRAKARETWKRMVTGNSQNAIGTKAASSDPKIYDRLADILQRENFAQEAIEYKQQAVALDESNHRRRWEYAQMLAVNERSADAIQQLQKLIELGDREQQTLTEQTKKKPIRRGRGTSIRQPFIPPPTFVYHSSRFIPQPIMFSGTPAYYPGMSIRYSSGRYGAPPQSAFQQLRSQALHFMATLAQDSIGQDALIEQFTKKIDDQPKSTQAKRDLMLIYQACGRTEDAIDLATGILELAPNDAELLQQIAAYHTSRQEHDKAITLYEKLAETQSQYRDQALSSIISLYIQKQNHEKAVALANQMVEENPDNIHPLLQLANLTRQQGQLDEAIAIYEKARKKTRNVSAVFFLDNLASLYKQKGDKDKAKKLYAEILAGDPAQPAAAARRPQVSLYIPPRDNRVIRHYGGSLLRALPPTLISSIDHQKAEAIRQLHLLSDEDDNPLQPLIDQAKQLGSAKSRDAKNKAWDAAKLLIASRIAENQLDKAQHWLDEAKAAAGDQMEWINLALYLAQSRDDCGALIELYNQAKRQFSFQARKIASAKAAVFILCKRYNEAAAHIRQMIQQRIPPKELVEAIRPLVNAGETQLAKELLKEHLSGISRNVEALTLLANIYSGEENYEQAITLAHEAWDRSPAGSSTPNYRRYSSYYAPPGRIRRPANNLLRNLHRYYVKAGRSGELIQEFAERLAKQPGSVRLHENLATLYSLNNQNNKAIEIYETLIQKRPRLVQAKQQLAGFYAQTGNLAKASALYEQLLQTNPNLYQQISRELQNFYRRHGQEKQILKFEENLARRATNPNQIQQLASQFQGSGNLEKAAELYQKAIRLSPSHPWLHHQLAGVYRQLGRQDDAIKLYKDWLTSPAIHAQSIGSHILQPITGLYASAGRLDELKEINQSLQEKNAKSPLANSLAIQIAIFEKRFEDAIERLTKAVKTGQNPNAVNDLINIGQITGRMDEVLKNLPDSALQKNFSDKRRLAKIYMNTGNIDRGKKLYKDWLEEQAGHGVPMHYYIGEAIRAFGDHGLWDDIEALIRKHYPKDHRQRLGGPMPHGRQLYEINEVVAEAYVEHNRFKNFVQEILDKETHTAAEAELLIAIAKQYEWSGTSKSQREAFLSQVASRNPGNQKLVSELSQIYFNNDQPEKAVALARQLVEAQPDNQSHRQFYANALLKNDQPEKVVALARQLIEAEPNNQSHHQLYADALFAMKSEAQAIAMLSSWAAVKETESRYSFLSRYQERAGEHAAARASLVKAMALADASRKSDAALQLAQFDAKRGNPEAVKEAYAKLFKERADAQTFQQYISYLHNSGHEEDARKLFLKHKDAGYINRYRFRNVFELFLDSENLDTLIDMAWKRLRYEESHRHSSIFYDVEIIFHNAFARRRSDKNSRASRAEKQKQFLNGIRKRAEAEKPPNQKILRLLAGAYKRAGLEEAAGELYGELSQQNPANQEYALQRANWLAKSGQTDEAIQLIERLPPAPTLHEEADNQLQFIQFYLKNQKPKRAQTAIDKLLAWKGDGDTEIKIGNLFIKREQYQKALAHYESGRNKYRQDRYLAGEYFINMGKCYAVQGQSAAAIESFEKARGKQNTERLFSELSDWLMQKKLYSTAVAWLEADLKTKTLDSKSHLTLAYSYIHLNQPKKAIAAYQNLWDQSTTESDREDIARGFESLILHHNLQEQLELAAPHPLLQNAQNRASTPSDQGDQISEGFFGITLLGELVREIPAEIRQNIEMSLEFLERYNIRNNPPAIPPPPPAILRSITAKPDLATPMTDADILQHVRENRGALLAQPRQLEPLFKAASEETARQLTEEINAKIPDAPHQAYYRFLAAHFRKKSASASKELNALIKNPKLPPKQLKHLAAICRGEGRADASIVFLNRLVGGGYGEDEKWEALRELPGLQLAVGDFAGAFSNFAKLPPRLHQTGRLLTQTIYTATDEQNLPLFRAAIATLIAEQPGRAQIPMLVGLYREICEKLGTTPKPFPLNPTQQEEANQFSNLIQTWEIAGPYDDEPFSKPPTDPAAWTKKIQPKDTFGFIDFDSLFNTESRTGNETAALPKTVEFEFAEMFRTVAYARTTLISPDERSITLAFETDDPGKVWINDEEIRFMPPPIVQNHASASVSLKAGENRLTVKVPNYPSNNRMSDAPSTWFFNIRIAENADSIAIQPLDSTPQQKADTAPNP